jgi:hypothetical protein
MLAPASIAFRPAQRSKVEANAAAATATASGVAACVPSALLVAGDESGRENGVDIHYLP